MKVGLAWLNNEKTIVLQHGGDWLDLSRALQVQCLVEEGHSPAPVQDIVELIRTGRMTLSVLTELVRFLDRHNLRGVLRVADPARFLLPFRPGKVLAVGRNYLAHAQETGFDPPEEPFVFAKSPEACVGDGDAIVIRESYGRVDHEAELAVVIGRRAKYVAEDEATDYIAGYTIVNDVTARGMQKADIDNRLPWWRSKSIDTFCPMGPVIALPDEVPWPVEVDIELRVNGEIRQKSNTREFIFSIPKVLSFITRFMTLMPGDVVSTGTPDGIPPVAPGETVEITIPEIGVLRNPVAPAGTLRDPS
ncbi:MAG TPA: fumarylacetoacetate hydrolase family protein [Candidatus Hydrogenedentes bacterium]|nr:fumarylacetoacetate hydrolase family protein [Candidatus Hydrogenedentota bacterium]HPG69099.1 fumarylacetoacetate hydrolase family protein [Candidatus Hydrogenedentota bacterium]